MPGILTHLTSGLLSYGKTLQGAMFLEDNGFPLTPEGLVFA